MYSSGSFSKIYRNSLAKTYDWRKSTIGKKVVAPLRWSWDGFYWAILQFKSQAFNPSDTILVTGAPRSGTTWLGELLSASRDYCVVFEPIVILTRRGMIKDADWADHIEADSNWTEGKKLFGKLFEGRGVPAHAFVHNSPADLMRCRSLVIKSINANRLLPWLSMNFKIKGMVLIIRHPCAVVASLKKHMKDLPRKVSLRGQRYVIKNLPHLADYVRGLQTVEEIYAVRWCCSHYVPFRYSKRDSWIEVSYEKLVLSGPEELRRIHSALGLSCPDKAIAHLTSSSLTSHNWSVDHNRVEPQKRLSNWKNILDKQQIRRILSVVEAFGISGFNDEVIPDFDNIKVTT